MAALAVGGFALALWAQHTLALPPKVIDPQMTKYLGRWIFLTYQSNVVAFAYFVACVFDTQVANGAYQQELIALFPLVFALGCFLTLAHYSLNHFNPEQRRRLEQHRSKYPYVFVSSHISHGHALPLVAWYAFTVPVDAASVVLPSGYSASRPVILYAVFYAVLSHANYFATGLWPYPIIEQVSRHGGVAMRCVFFVLLALGFVALSSVGLNILRERATP
ncbi:hypothetical protein AB1Y20_015523 [Prymnesium parvum]|uniref:Polyprenol reductase n=1 Tax=Prymnesium parvum TaxID=97485 RepID=A0AB34K1T0_PRYPA